jgi:hypothetical protein
VPVGTTKRQLFDIPLKTLDALPSKAGGVLPLNITALKDEQPLNALLSIAVTPLGMKIEAKPLSSKAQSLIRVTLFGRMTFCKL